MRFVAGFRCGTDAAGSFSALGAVFVVALLLLLGGAHSAHAATAPAGFQDQPVTSGVPNATAIAFTPTGAC